jgi:hypothetical protein
MVKLDVSMGTFWDISESFGTSRKRYQVENTMPKSPTLPIVADFEPNLVYFLRTKVKCPQKCPNGDLR